MAFHAGGERRREVGARRPSPWPQSRARSTTPPTHARPWQRLCARQGAKPDHVDVEPADGAGTRAWRWHLITNAPVVELRDVWVFETVVDRNGCPRATGRSHHPKLDRGVVVEVDGGYFVVADDDGEAVEDLIAAAMSAR